MPVRGPDPSWCRGGATAARGGLGATAQLLGGAACAVLAALVLQSAGEKVAVADPAVSAVPPSSACPSTQQSEQPGPRAAPVASYALTARLDAEQHVVSAQGTVRFTNSSSQAVAELWLHLYLNAFKNEKTLFLRSPFSAARSAAPAADFGYIDVRRLVARELGNVDLWPGAAAHSPNDPDDQTDIRVPLPQPLEPGQTLTLDVEFESKLPQLIERTGYLGMFHFVAQWFPKLARLRPDGTWAHFAFHPLSEFYADFGDYAITLDVPDTMQVGATGARTEEQVQAGRRLVRHEAFGVHDFAWTAWDRFEERRERVAEVDVRLLYPPGHDHNAELTLGAIRFALPHYNAAYGRYPYPVLTVVHPPPEAQPAGGMEYPTLITTGGAWYAGYLSRSVEAVTVHELGHQWFYGLVATDEHTWPFLDEGLTTYAEDETLQAMYGAGSLMDWPGLRVAIEEATRGYALLGGQPAPIGAPATKFPNFPALGTVVYARTATLLRTLAGVYSETALCRALHAYATRYRFRHPEPDALLSAIREYLGDDAAEALRVAVFERGWVDFRVAELRTTPAHTPAGVFDGPTGREVRDQEALADPAWVSEAVIVREGSLRLPVEIELVAESGERSRQHWDGRTTFTRVTHEGPDRIVSVVVDPDRHVLLDQDFLNNAQRLEPGSLWHTTAVASHLTELLLSLGGP